MYKVEHNQGIAKELANRSLVQVIGETSLLFIIAITALLGNSCVLYVFYKSPEIRKKVVSYYLITLAISDVIMSSIFMPFLMAASACGHDVIGFKGGQYFGIISMPLLYGSILTTVMIAVNRFFCVVKPQIYQKLFKPKPALLMIVAIWIVPFVFVICSTGSSVVFYFYPGRYMYYPAFTNYTIELVTGTFTYLFVGFLPLLLTGYCYWKVQKQVQVHSASLRAGSVALTFEEVNITKSLVAVVAGFGLCWCTGCTLIYVDIYINLPRSLDMLMVYLACLSSAINPFIYNTVNRRFRRQFFNIIRSRSAVTTIRIAPSNSNVLTPREMPVLTTHSLNE